MSVVAYQAPVQYQDPVGLLGPPPLRLRYEPLVLRLRWTISTSDDRDDQAEHVHGQSALAAGHPLGRIVATRGGGDPGGHVDTLGVQDTQSRVLQSAGPLPYLAAQEFVAGGR
ncbi:hypothetical protein AMK31_35600 [Streptomyces sp. TSRI0107]|nr:hypothetical protein AMK31_35600 [Streptomyces sp. TSRI0107]